MKLKTASYRRPPRPPVRILTGEMSPEENREFLLKLLNWYRDRKIERRGSRRELAATAATAGRSPFGGHRN